MVHDFTTCVVIYTPIDLCQNLWLTSKSISSWQFSVKKHKWCKKRSKCCLRQNLPLILEFRIHESQIFQVYSPHYKHFRLERFYCMNNSEVALYHETNQHLLLLTVLTTDTKTKICLQLTATNTMTWINENLIIRLWRKPGLWNNLQL